MPTKKAPAKRKMGGILGGLSSMVSRITPEEEQKLKLAKRDPRAPKVGHNSPTSAAAAVDSRRMLRNLIVERDSPTLRQWQDQYRDNGKSITGRVAAAKKLVAKNDSLALSAREKHKARKRKSK